MAEAESLIGLAKIDRIARTIGSMKFEFDAVQVS